MYIKLAETESDLLGILNLQNENHFDNVSPELQESKGFVTVRHSLPVLQLMNEKAKIWLETSKMASSNFTIKN